MRTTYKNITDTIVVIGDLNIKFSPKGKRGDTVDLLKFFNLTKIEKSADLQYAVTNQWLSATGKPSSTEPALRKVMPSKNTKQPKAQPGQPKYFFVRKKGLTQKMDSKTAVAYDQANRNVVSVPLNNQKETKKTEVFEEIVDSTKIATIVREPTDNPKEAIPKPREATENTSDTQKAQAITVSSQKIIPSCAHVKSDGEKCKRRTKNDNPFCYVHTPEI